MSRQFNGWAAFEAKGKIVPHSYQMGALKPEQVDIKVDYCGLCHSDLSMLHNEWGMSRYPVVAGHEVVGTVAEIGSAVTSLKVGQKVGLGWFSGSCRHCQTCMSGDHNLCAANEYTIVGRFGGFADYVRCNWEWATVLPEAMDEEAAGPLFCGGITVFHPIVQFEIKPTDRVGVIGIGGLGHLALQFLNKWGCEVTAFSSTPGKEEEAKKLGAHHVVNSRDGAAMASLAGRFDFIMNTTAVDLDWNAYLQCLAPRGRFHTVGIIPSPMSIPALSLVAHQRSISGSPLGSPATTRKMLDFCLRHGIKAQVETFPMSQINEALAHLEAGKARYRVVLKN